MARKGTAAAPLAGGGGRFWLWIALALVIVVLDQFTKVLVMHEFKLGDSRAITSYFNLVRVHNAGAAFSFLAGASGWQRWFFIVLGIVATVFIVWLLRKHPEQTLFCLAVTLIMGGAVGNVIDRAWHGHVVDFLQFRFSFLEPLFPGGYFPSFNVADAAITGGAVGMILDEVRRVIRS